LGKIIDVVNAERPTRYLQDGSMGPQDESLAFRAQFPPAANKYGWLQREVLFPQRTAPVNPNKSEVTDWAALTEHIKEYAKSLGADDVGIADMNEDFTFTDRDPLPHTRVIAFAMNMKYDSMADIGQASQTEVHRVYFKMLDVSVQLARYIGGFGYQATGHPNQGEYAHVPFAYLAGLGELGKHGSLISPTLGSSIRLGLVSTDMPLVVDGPKDYGIDDMCTRCTVCTRFCPADAISPEKKVIKGVERFYVDTAACRPLFQHLWGCKICLMVCPFNGRGVFKEQYRVVAKDIAVAKEKHGYLKILAKRTPGADTNKILSEYL
jgi:epoxyqueuosine reductase